MMKSTKLQLIALILLCSGCHPKAEYGDLEKLIEKKHDGIDANTEVITYKPSYQPVAFVSKGRADPFMPSSQQLATQKLITCKQEAALEGSIKQKDKDLFSLVYKGLIREGKHVWGLVLTQDSILLPVSVGQMIGKGKVKSITEKMLSITTYSNDAMGCLELQDVRLFLDE